MIVAANLLNFMALGLPLFLVLLFDSCCLLGQLRMYSSSVDMCDGQFTNTEISPTSKEPSSNLKRKYCLDASTIDDDDADDII